MHPSYLRPYDNGRLKKKIEAGIELLNSCLLCPRKCGVNRAQDQKGFCRTGRLARVYSYIQHFGEEPPISGYRGSGTIFFSGCNMNCVYCQNYKFSQLNPAPLEKSFLTGHVRKKSHKGKKLSNGVNQGREVTAEELAQFMLELQKSGCHNINLVTPTHVMPQILEALYLAIPEGLRLPLVYNTSGYELPEVIELLEDIVDIYLADMRYAEGRMSKKYSNAENYPEYNQAAVVKMFQQVGVARINSNGLMERGLIIRHLVLPGNIAGTEKVMRFISRKISTCAHISLMSQYLPCHKATDFPELSRHISEQEYAWARQVLLKFGLCNGWLQESRGSARLAGVNIKPID